MKRVLVRYKVKAGRAEENERLVWAVYEELHESQPDDFRYATVKADDGVTFFHMASIGESGKPLPETDAFKAFQQDLADRCDEPPVATDVTEIGSYGYE